MKKTFLAIAALALMLMNCTRNAEQIPQVNYPISQKVDTVDTYFGHEVRDPYRWLEDDRSAETGQWVKEQNDVTFGFLANIPYREQVQKRLEELYNYERLGAPFREGDYYYFYKNDGLQNHSV